MEPYLAPTEFIDSDHPSIITFVKAHTTPEQSPVEKAVSLFYGVRDKIRYNPYSFGRTPEAMRASFILSQGEGYCVAKAVLLCACARAAGIPARIGFADVRNHLSNSKLREEMGTDMFVYHGYTEMFLEDKWVKATPAFNLELCENFDYLPVEFNGRDDSMFHAADKHGRKHMEYIKNRGVFADLPLSDIYTESAKWYPKLLEGLDIPDTGTDLKRI